MVDILTEKKRAELMIYLVSNANMFFVWKKYLEFER